MVSFMIRFSTTRLNMALWNAGFRCWRYFRSTFCRVRDRKFPCLFFSDRTAGSSQSPVYLNGNSNGNASAIVSCLQSVKRSLRGMWCKSEFQQPFWFLVTNVLNSSWFVELPLVGSGRVVSGKTTVMLIWFSMSTLSLSEKRLQSEIKNSQK